MEELRLPGAAEGHEAEQDTHPIVADTLQGVLQGPYFEDRLRPKGVGPCLDHAPQLLYLLVQFFCCRVERSPDEEPRRLANGVACEVFSAIHLREDVNKADRVSIEDRGRFWVVPDLGRVTSHGQNVFYTQCRSPEQVGLQPDNVPVAA